MDILNKRISCTYRWNGWRFADCMVVKDRGCFQLLHNNIEMAGSRSKGAKGYRYSRNVGTFSSVESMVAQKLTDIKILRKMNHEE
jgi:hypothetical protein